MLAYGMIAALVAAQAEPSREVQALQSLIEARGDYVSLRDRILAELDTSDGLTTKGLEEAARNVTEQTWETAVFAEALIVRRRDPAAANLVDRPGGLVPSVYLRNRAAKPLPLPDLRRVPREKAALLFELFFRAEEVGAYSTKTDFPPRLTSEEVAYHQQEERAALVPAVLQTLAQSGHPAAGYLLRKLAEKGDGVTRPFALTALGETSAPFAEDVLRTALRGSDAKLVISAMVGMAKLPTGSAFEALLTVVRSTKDPSIRRAGMGSLSAALWRANGRQLDSAGAQVLSVLHTTSSEDDVWVSLASDVAKVRPAVWARFQAQNDHEKQLMDRVSRRLEWSRRRSH